MRDLARWCIQMVEDGHAGVYNAVGPNGTLTMEELLHGCKVVAGADARFTWVSEDFLLAQDVAPWMEMPLWIPVEEAAGLSRIDSRKAVARGLSFRPTAQTIADTLAWHATRKDHVFKTTLKAEKEKAVLAAWKRKQQQPPPAAPSTGCAI